LKKQQPRVAQHISATVAGLRRLLHWQLIQQGSMAACQLALQQQKLQICLHLSVLVQL
jgi:hypothetical protein